MAPLVSVVIPTYNDSTSDLRRSVDSVLSQSYSEVEVVVVDDGSVWPFARIDDELQREGVRLLALPGNVGVAAARNAAARVSVGALLAFLDTGDWWAPTKLERQVPLFRGGKLTIACCGATIHRSRASVTIWQTAPPDWENALLIGMPVVGSASSLVCARDAYEECGGFFEGGDLPEDRDLCYRLARRGEVGFVPDPLVHRSIGTTSRSTDPATKRLTYRRFLDRHAEAIVERGLARSAEAYYHAAIALKYLQTDRYAMGLLFSTRSILSQPRGYVVARAAVGVLAMVSGVKFQRIGNLARAFKHAVLRAR